MGFFPLLNYTKVNPTPGRVQGGAGSRLKCERTAFTRRNFKPALGLELPSLQVLFEPDLEHVSKNQSLTTELCLSAQAEIMEKSENQ